TTAKMLAKHFKTLDDFLKTTKEDLINIDGIGELVANDIILDVQKPLYRDLIQKLKKFIYIEPYVCDTAVNSELSGKTIVFTGKLQSLSRQEAKSQAERLGAHVSNSISSKTDYIVVGENAGSKLSKAKEKEVKILTEDEWCELVNLTM
ncbi:MAG: BRCT domain-containing protein, partial [Alphaproteobacteria bacterium]